MTDAIPALHLAALDLRGRRVLVAGAGAVAWRRIEQFLAVGAEVVVVAPEADPAVQALAEAGRVVWHRRPAVATDVAEAWFVMVATSDPGTNAALGAAAEAARIFCVRADRAEAGTARTPAVLDVPGFRVGVVGDRDPRGSMALRERIATALSQTTLTQTTPLPAGTDLEPGTVTLVGGGPGDPGLVTVAGLRALRQADVVLVDHLAPQDCLAEVSETCRVIGVGKQPRGAFVPQETINQLLVEHARAGARVVRFKGGDSFVFGRGGEEAQACAEAGIAVRVIPGITSSVAAPELAGIPVTHRSLTQGFVVVSGHVPPGDPRSTVDWPAVARAGLTVVVLMGVKYLPQITAALLDAGMPGDLPASVVSRAGHPSMQRLDAPLGEIAARAAVVEPPAVTVIGEVAGLDLA